MGSDLYEVRVLGVADKTVSLDVHVVHPDAMDIPEDPGFALMLLRDAAHDASPLAREVALQDLLDDRWMKEHATGFVRAVRVSDVTHAPTQEAQEDPSHPYWESDQWMRARVDVTATHPAWIQHLKPDMTWDSRAFAPLDDYDRCAPIAPEEADPKTEEDADAFVWVPRECFPTVELEAPLLEMPAYSPSAYAEAQSLPLDGRIDEWMGAYVRAVDHDRGGSVEGVLGRGKDWLFVLQMSLGSSGCHGLTRPGSIRLLVPKKGRRGTRLGYARILGAASTTISAISRSGRTAEFSVRFPPDGRTLPALTASDAFALLVAPLLELNGLREAPLSSALRRDLEERGYEARYRIPDAIYPDVALRYVAGFDVQLPAPAPAPRFDAMTHAEVREALSAPWPVAKVRVEVRDERWIEHLDPATHRPFAMARPFPPPRPVEGIPEDKPAALAAPDERVVLWTEAGPLNQYRIPAVHIWIGERAGFTWTARRGKLSERRSPSCLGWWSRGLEDKSEKTYRADSAEVARAALHATAASMRSEGYRDAPSLAEARATVWRRLGIEFDPSGRLLVTRVSPAAAAIRVQETVWLRPGDWVSSRVGYGGVDYPVTVVEEIALVLASVPNGAEVWLQVYRPSLNSGTSVSLTAT